MFADDANLFLTHKDVRYLFETANLQLNVTLSLNISKTTYSFLHKPSKMEDVPLLLNSKIKNICWKDYSKYIESKFAKNIWLLHKAEHYVDNHSLLSLHHSYMHFYINYGSIP